MGKLIIIRNENDILEIKKYIEKDIQNDITSNLLGLLKIYKQFVYDFESGDVLFAIYNDILNISIEAASKYFKVKQFFYEDKNILNDLKSYFYNAETDDIICGLDKNDNIQVTGNILYDSLGDQAS